MFIEITTAALACPPFLTSQIECTLPYNMSEKEVLVVRGQVDGQDGWSPDIVVGVDFGMTYTGRLALNKFWEQLEDFHSIHLS
jgi:hypothetical protein